MSQEPKSTIEYIYLEEGETVALVHMGLRVEAAFGPGWVALKWDTSCTSAARS